MNKIIFISNSLADMKNVKEFAKKNRYQQEYYSVRSGEEQTQKRHGLGTLCLFYLL